jgi:NADP-dependent 3-hydroxy acid dehydrogenase YdfG
MQGRVALVTGASSGAGRAIAASLAAAGASVVLVARRRDRLDALAADILAAGGTAHAVTADLADAAQAAAAVEAAVTRFGRLDVLVNDAGVMLNGPLEEIRLGDLERMIATNVTGLVAACHAAVPRMLAQGGGDIVNISSIAARLANASSATYSATKAAVTTFSEALRKEVTRRGVRVSVIEPGLIDTELGDHVPHAASRERFEKMRRSWTPLRPEDLASAVLWIVTQPRHVAINAVVIRPTEQEL